MRSKGYIWVSMMILVIATLGCGMIGVRAFTNLNDDSVLFEPVSVQAAPATPLSSLSFAAIPTPVPEALIAQADAEEALLINLYERVNPAVVNIEVVLENPHTFGNGPLPDPDTPLQPPDEDFGPFNPRGQGTGFVYSQEGYIVSNSHVIEGAEAIFVTFYNGQEFPAEVVGADPDSDLAVLKVETSAEWLLPVQWGDSDKLFVGQRAVAIGNPFGLEGSLTNGIISGLRRELFSLSGAFRIPEVIQTDAAINPGNSGGPLLNSRGEVIGVNSAIVPRQVGFGERSFLGVGFAVPSNLAQRVIPALIAQGYYEHPWLGIEVNDVTSEIAEAMQLDEARGALVVRVLPDTPASKAKLRGGNREFTNRNDATTQIGGDVIIGLGDEEINSFSDLISFLSRKGEVGQPVKVVIIRDGQQQTLEVTPAGRPQSP